MMQVCINLKQELNLVKYKKTVLGNIHRTCIHICIHKNTYYCTDYLILADKPSGQTVYQYCR